MAEQKQITRTDGTKIAYNLTEGKGAGIVFLGGFMSNKEGTKALALESWARQTGHRFLRFDYFGHGQSSGDFVEGTIGRWIDDARDVVTSLTKGPQILVGSSMGGWIALALAQQHPEHVAGVVGVAAAPDFTTRLMWPDLDPTLQQIMKDKGVAEVPSDYGQPYPVTYQLIEESRNHLLLDTRIKLSCPVHLLQGQKDTDVPWRHGLAILDALDAPEAWLTLIKDGDHSLSTDSHLAAIIQAIEAMTKKTSAE